jgi:ribosome-associated protein
VQRDAIRAVAVRTGAQLATRLGFAASRFFACQSRTGYPRRPHGQREQIVPNDDSGANVRPLCLDQFMKLSSIAGSGGQAKVMIQSGEVKVNGKVETRRRRKLVSQDRVEVNGDTFLVKDFISTE